MIAAEQAGVASEQQTILEARNVVKSFGQTQALRGAAATAHCGRRDRAK